MKKIFPHLIILSLGFLFTPLLLSAASITLSGTNSIQVGKTYVLTIGVDPTGQKIYTVKAAFSYPSEMLSVTSFTFSDAWIPLSQPGYNEINNDTGKMIKTGGYPSGLSSPVVFGMVRFIGLKEGMATVAINDDSAILDSQSKNILTGKGRLSLTLVPTEQKKIPTTNTKAEPTTKKENGVAVPDHYINMPLPNDIPSPDKAWLYTRLAFLSIAALLFKHWWSIFFILGFLLYIAFRRWRR